MSHLITFAPQMVENALADASTAMMLDISDTSPLVSLADFNCELRSCEILLFNTGCWHSCTLLPTAIVAMI
jgi:hypothetical protein